MWRQIREVGTVAEGGTESWRQRGRRVQRNAGQSAMGLVAARR